MASGDSCSDLSALGASVVGNCSAFRQWMGRGMEPPRHRGHRRQYGDIPQFELDGASEAGRQSDWIIRVVRALNSSYSYSYSHSYSVLSAICRAIPPILPAPRR